MKKGERKPYVPDPWTREPDKKEWSCRGYRCAALRDAALGTWCGYLGVPKEHPWHGRGDFHDLEREVQVHGGLTFSGKRSMLYDGGRMLWWVGFDCAQAHDLWPKLPHVGGVVYRDLNFVTEQLERLAEQAEKAAKESETLSG